MYIITWMFSRGKQILYVYTAVISGVNLCHAMIQLPTVIDINERIHEDVETLFEYLTSFSCNLPSVKE